MNGFDYLPAGTTTQTSPRSYDRIREDMERYIREDIMDIFEFGLKIKDRNIFWAMMMQDKVTKQTAFTLMVGNWTIVNYCSEGKI